MSVALTSPPTVPGWYLVQFHDVEGSLNFDGPILRLAIAADGERTWYDDGSHTRDGGRVGPEPALVWDPVLEREVSPDSADAWVPL